MTQIIDEYFAALRRIKNGKTIKIPKGSRINKDNVALEAGRGKGSIKKSRSVFNELIEAIQEAANEQDDANECVNKRIELTKREVENYRSKWEQALAREISLLNEIYHLKKELAAIKGSDILPIRRQKS